MSVFLRRWLRLAGCAPRLAGLLVRWGGPKRALLFGPRSLGDDLLCSAVLHEARRRGDPFAFFTNRPELFEGNSDPAKLIPIDNYHVQCVRSLGGVVVQPYYSARDPDNPDRDLLPDRHVIAEMCRLAGLKGQVRLRPYFFLNDTERTSSPRHRHQIAMQSTGLAASLPFLNKEWGVDRFAAVAEKLRDRYHLIQLGAAFDPALPVHTDLRGKTSLREAAAVLANSLVFVGIEGFLVHLARAVECRSVVIMGGRISPKMIGYNANANLFSLEPCAPCGLRNTCPHSLVCMTKITPDTVLAAVENQVCLHGQPLPVETTDI